MSAVVAAEPQPVDGLRRFAPWALAGISVVALVISGVLGWTNHAPLSDGRLGASDVGWFISYLAFVCIGALVVSRHPDSRIAKLMLLAGSFNAFAQLALQYAIWGEIRHPGSLPAADVMAWLSSYLWLPSIATIILVAAYLPTGRLLSRRWLWLPIALVVTSAVVVGLSAVDWWPYRGADLLLTAKQDQLAHTAAWTAVGSLWPVVSVCAVAALLSIVVRYVRSRGLERQQLKWLMLAAAVSAPFVLISELTHEGSALYAPAQILSSPVFFGVAIGFAVMRYRLYDIDRIVSRTVSYGLVTALLIGVYVGCVALTTSVLSFGSSFGVAASTLAAAAAFQPVRRRVQRVVDRHFDRAAYDAQRTIEEFHARLRDRIDVDGVRDEFFGTVTTAVAPTTVTLWLADS